MKIILRRKNIEQPIRVYHDPRNALIERGAGIVKITSTGEVFQYISHRTYDIVDLDIDNIEIGLEIIVGDKIELP